MRRTWLVLPLFALTAAGASSPYMAGLMPGRYDVTQAGTGGTRSVCIADLGVLLQLAHGPDQCRFFPVLRNPDRTRVSYECAGGSGLVSVVAVTPRTAEVSASGVRGSTPYKVRLTARRSGECR